MHWIVLALAAVLVSHRQAPGSARAVLVADTAANAVTHAAQQPETGWATFYAVSFDGHRTASGEIFHSRALVAAHPSLPFGTAVRVTNLSNNRSVTVRIIDRGPAAEQVAQGYVIDLSRAAARHLHMRREGRAKVRIEIVSNADGSRK